MNLSSIEMAWVKARVEFVNGVALGDAHMALSPYQYSLLMKHGNPGSDWARRKISEWRAAARSKGRKGKRRRR